jgi:tetratricopeptide (TPR) repeat protein
MQAAANPPVATRAIGTRGPLVLAILIGLAVIGLVGVNQLVVLHRRQVRKLAEKAYQFGLAEQQSGKPQRAIEDFRAALSYDPDNDQYQLSLGRALRDTGHLDEAESYLFSLWQRTPQDSTINLALARLAVRKDNLDEALRYYHNAIYGVWKFDPDNDRRQARFELIEFLLQKGALPQAQAELVGVLPTLPKDPALHLRVAEMLNRAQDYNRALTEFQYVLQKDHHNAAALLGAGQAAFQLARYRTAQIYLLGAVNADTGNERAAPLLQNATLVLQADPFRRGISDVERDLRIQVAFAQSGRRLDSCLAPPDLDASSATDSSAPALPPDLAVLKTKWKQMQPKVSRLSDESSSELEDAVMDLVFQIEQQTQTQCGPPQALDQALLAIARDPTGVDR